MSNSIVICGATVFVGTPVVLWEEGFNAYDKSPNVTKIQDRRTGRTIKRVIKGKRYSKRKIIEPTLYELLNKTVTQLFLHHTGLYSAKDTFHVLHNQRGLSVHFILDDDGTIYQTLDLREKAWHGGTNNPMSIGMEICSRAHASRFPYAYDRYHQEKYDVLPRKKNIDFIHNKNISGYEYNDFQYAALIKLGIALKLTFPLLGENMFFPMFDDGSPSKTVISRPKTHRGMICHYNTNINKNDPICLDHYRLTEGINNEDPNQSSELFSVKDIQLFLNEIINAELIVDGDYGPKTKSAVKDFQRHGINVESNGVWNYETRHQAIRLANK
jgi:N-acetyl-anhydromuramyl-L-alanine amidase AmpD